MGIKYLPTKKDLQGSIRFKQQRELINKIKKDTAPLTEKKAKKK